MAYPSPTDINWTAGAGAGVDYVNSVTNGVFSNMLLLVVYVIILFGVYKANNKDIVSGLAVAGFVVTIVALIMWIGGWVTWVTFGVCVALAIVGAAAILLDRK